MLSTAIYTTGALLTVSTIPWSMVMRGVTVSWKVLSLISSRSIGDPTVDILLDAIASIISDRQRLPHIDIFCDLVGWSRLQSWSEPELLLYLHRIVDGYILPGDVRLALTEIFNEMEHLTTTYIRASTLELGGSIGLLPYWLSIEEFDRLILLKRHDVTSFAELSLIDLGVTECLHRWVASRSATIKLLCATAAKDREPKAK
jgi:hypothetical protein